MTEDEIRAAAKVSYYTVKAKEVVPLLDAKDAEIARLRTLNEGPQEENDDASPNFCLPEEFRKGMAFATACAEEEIARLREVAASTSLPKDLFEIARLRAALDAIDHGAASAAETLVCADCGLRSATVKDGLCYRCTPT